MASLILDYDGTLHESLPIYAPAFRLAYEYLVRKHLAPQRAWTDYEISLWLGFSAKEMWANFMPGLDQTEKDTCSRIIGDEMLRLTLGGKSKLYSQALPVLQGLKAAGFHLIFLSNCKHSYMQAHRAYWGLDQYFSAFYCTEDFAFAPKWQIFNSMKECHAGGCLVIGDRYQDIEIAIKHQLPSVGCLYGYGNTEELQSASIRVHSPEDILDAVPALLADC